ncbi:hypothetical protein EDB83DRAFT_2310877 [Lactarius deliciosus]|nr:hypothetical protein EDB83DRAFT_2310877 [Lactarius deliciosus]
MQAGNCMTDGEEDGVGNMSIDIHFSLLGSFLTPTLTPAASTIALIHGYPQPRTSKPHAPHVPSWQCRLAITQRTGRRDLDQDDGNGNDEGDKCGDGESESDDRDDGDGDDDDDSLLATLKCDDLIAWVAAHDIEPQNKWATKKIIKAIMGAVKLEHPSKEDVQEIIELHQAKRNTRTA